MSITILERTGLDRALVLINGEGWNYTVPELERMLDLDPAGSFWYEDGRTLGVVTTVAYGSTGVVGHLVVSEHARGQNIGRTLLQKAIDHFESKGLNSMIVFAADYAQRFYEKLGFSSYRWLDIKKVQMPSPSLVRTTGRVAKVTADDIDDIVAIDSGIFGDSRSALLGRLFKEFPEYSFKLMKAGDIVGYVFARKTSVAHDLGPWACLTGLATDAQALLDSVVKYATSGNMYIESFRDNKEAVAIIDGMTCVGHWPVRLMIKGLPRYESDVDKLYGIVGVELG